MMKKEARRSRRQSVWGIVLLVFLALVLIPLIIVILAAYLLVTLLLHVLAWLVWSTRGIHLLYVYSNSPNWQEYIEKNILPRLPAKAIVLNWSERKKWRPSLSTLVFHHFGGYREFNPMAVVFRPFRWVKVFRFFKPFRDFKHGRREALEKMEAEFFDVLNR